MPLSSRLKQIAQMLDPSCWKSYSGRTVEFKRFIEARRATCLIAAANYAVELKRHVGTRSANLILDQHIPITKIEQPQRITRWSGLDYFKLETKNMPWTAFKMKIMLHISCSPQYSYLSSLAPLEFLKSARSRAASFDKVVAELIRDDMIIERDKEERIYTATERGRVFVEAVLNMRLPIQAEPKWVMPNEHGNYKPGDIVAGFGPGPSPVQEC